MASHQILIVGAGTAGITVAAQLLNKDPKLDIAIVDPSEIHYYQPAWTLVGGGTFNRTSTARPQKDYIPSQATWIKNAVTKLNPANNQVTLDDGSTVDYEWMVLAPGIQIDYDKIEGLRDTLGKNGVCTNYDYEQCAYTWEAIRSVKAGGTALFTNPNTPIKCGGAPQKIMYLASDYFRKQGILDQVNVKFTSAGGVIFGVQPYKASLEDVIKRYGIETVWHHNLKKIDGPNRKATFDILKDGKPVDEVTLDFDMIHVTPPMSAPDFIKESPLAADGNWVKVDKHSMQSPDYPNVFSLGDAAGTPNAKTGAAIRKQVPVVTENLLAAMKGSQGNGSYNGYGSCPLITGYGKLILAEFDYDNNSTPSFPFDQSKERWSMFILKKHLLPWFYWNRMMQGKT
jgi:sulfide:quinone oxidoreductase